MSNIKLIFEGWRRHLAEQEDREAFEKLVQYFKDSARTDMNSATHAAEMAKSIGAGISEKFHNFLLKEKRKAQEEVYKYTKYYHKYDPGAMNSVGPVRDTFNELNYYVNSIELALSVYNTKG